MTELKPPTRLQLTALSPQGSVAKGSPVKSAPAPEALVEAPPPAPDLPPDPVTSREQPIPPPSDALQYRAIGLVEGTYQPSEEHFTRGTLTTVDGAELDAVLLGRVMNLAKKHVELDKPHLWVVYPRTRELEQTLHVQVMGLWAPEAMGQPLPTQTDPIQPDYFSIRGEVVYQSQENEFFIVKIVQTPKKDGKDRPTSFKLRLEGTLPAKSVGNFWSFEVRRQGSCLMKESGTLIPGLSKAPARPRLRKPGTPRPFRPDPPRPTGMPIPRPSLARPSQSSPTESPIKPSKPIKKNRT